MVMCSFIIILSCNKKKTTPPTAHDVEIVKESIKQKLLSQNKKIQFSSLFDNNLKDFLQSKKMIIRIIVIFIAVSFIITVILLLLRYFITNRQIKLNNNFKQLNNNKASLFKNTQDIHQLVEDGNYNEAILLLHYHSIFFLLQNHVVYIKNMTNFDFFRKIKDKKDIAEAFKIIYKISEKIVFDNYKANFNEYEKCALQYKKYFTENSLL